MGISLCGSSHPVPPAAPKPALERLADVPVLGAMLAPAIEGFLMATQTPELQPHYEKKWGPIAGGIANFGARVATGAVFAGITALILGGAAVEMGINVLQGKKAIP